MIERFQFPKDSSKILFLKHARESTFLISIGILFHSLMAERAKERPPSVSLLYLGHNGIYACISSVTIVALVIDH